jgi:hypothetical protein
VHAVCMAGSASAILPLLSNGIFQASLPSSGITAMRARSRQRVTWSDGSFQERTKKSRTTGMRAQSGMALRQVFFRRWLPKYQRMNLQSRNLGPIPSPRKRLLSHGRCVSQGVAIAGTTPDPAKRNWRLRSRLFEAGLSPGALLGSPATPARWVLPSVGQGCGPSTTMVAVASRPGAERCALPRHLL